MEVKLGDITFSDKEIKAFLEKRGYTVERDDQLREISYIVYKDGSSVTKKGKKTKKEIWTEPQDLFIYLVKKEILAL